MLDLRFYIDCICTIIVAWWAYRLYVQYEQSRVVERTNLALIESVADLARSILDATAPRTSVVEHAPPVKDDGPLHAHDSCEVPTTKKVAKPHKRTKKTSLAEFIA